MTADKNHVDGFSDPASHHAGQRLATALVYLTTVPDEAGGATRVGAYHEVQPILGRLLVFHNCHGKTNTVDHHSSHAGLPVQGSVEKWAFNLWYHEYQVTPTMQPAVQS